MSSEGIFQIALILATFLCSLVAGFLLAFALVVMPGIKSLNDSDFIRAFQVMDRIIQNNQPFFVSLWVGSVVALIIATVLGIAQFETRYILIIFATLAYLLGVQLPTITINIPLNNKIQTLDVDTMSETMQRAFRQDFESRWNLWNSIRTVFASLASALLIILLFMI
ncbi:DUF1772 domain-containing protein [Rhodocaloribacter litoris]|uniref:anthrone oxygenase family protein n=1 Tax=Rhodocaloribacter litoris TaxID=2558931 RepID=UPI00141F77D3|nr:DUF1772 domain-containing protein [Rhodocaloribacter litoris]QXD14138.1 DUF1772 domain-containing protein [Rhodocaloribacter litoris]